MDIVNCLIAFNLGLFSTLHCLVMCGGIITALTVGGMRSGNSTAHPVIYVIAYNLGRISSYTLAGAGAGFIGANVTDLIMPVSGHRYLQIAASIILMLIGLHLAGWLPRLRYVEAIGMKFWGWIQPVGRLFMPVNHPGKALVLGIIWGWLPCALVYSVLLWAVTSDGIFSGALIMFMFGLGTLPGMLGVGMLGSRFTETFQHGSLRIWAGMIILLFGLATLLLLNTDMQFMHLHDHHRPAP